MTYRITLLFITGLLFAPPAVSRGEVEILETLTVDRVWSGHSVGFALLTHAPRQFVAYYNAGRQLTVASRELGDKDWTYMPLPEHVGWDSHNYVTMAVDDEARLHLSGNMHVHPLKYFQSAHPLDIQSLARVETLVGPSEDRMTYPRFFRAPGGDLIYTYRDGSSGSGNQIYNVYDSAAGSWRRLLDRPLTDGRGEMNAYIDGPKLGPDGRYHMVWVWRDTPDCATNHHISYMRSDDLRHWESASGDALSLPVTIDTPGTVVDPVPPGGGLINGNAKLGFDREKRPVVAYHKYGPDGNSQVFNARWDGTAWAVAQTTRWTSRWEFGGNGSIDFQVRVQPVRVEGPDLIQGWQHWELGHQRWRLDPETLVATEQLPPLPDTTPAEFRTLQSNFPGMAVRTASDTGKSPDPGTRYVLRWESLGPNRDRPRQPPHPDPATLTLWKLK